MGLAASQARFLGITARKNSCELRSMQIAQEKISISSQLSQITADYQRSLDATRLVWDSEYILDGSVYDVSYDLLMQPSELNDYSPQILTNLRNQVVLDNQHAKALRDITSSVGTKWDPTNGKVGAKFADLQLGGAARTETNFRIFLEGLNKGGVLGEAKYDAMIAALNKEPKFYRSDNGLGGDIQEMFTVNSMNLATLKQYINTITNFSSKYMNDLKQNSPNYPEVERIGNLLKFATNPYSEKPYEYNVTSGTTTKTYQGSFGEWATKDDQFRGSITLSDTSFNLADLLNKEITLSTNDAVDMGSVLSAFINQMYFIMQDFFAVDENSVDQNYLDYAMSQICELNNMKWDKATSKAYDFREDKVLNSGSPARDHTSIIKTDSTYNVSLSNVVKGIMTYFEKAVEGFSSGYKVESAADSDKKVADSYYVTQNPSYYYFIDNPESIDNVDQETQCLLEFYSQLFNQICANGWTENAAVSDNDMLKNMLRNGTLFTSTLSDDGMFYQGPYTSNNYIAEVADEDAIARAELEFKTKQAQLNAKEEKLNIDMQMVDAELSALTTEFDTVKGLISKAIEKGFSTLGGG